MAITRKQAQSLHSDLPAGGVWRTIRGNHVYIKDGMILAGAGVGKTGKPVKMTKKALDAHFAELNAAKEAAPKGKPAAKTVKQTDKPAVKPKTDKASSRKDKAVKQPVKQDVKQEKPKTKAKPKAEPAPKAEPKTKAKPKAEPAPKAEPKTKAKPKAEPAPKAEPKTKAKPKAAPKAQEVAPKDEPKIKTKPKAKTKPKEEPKIADVRTEGQTGNELAYDVGEKVWGSRKDLEQLKERIDGALKQGTSVERIMAQLEAHSPRQAERFCIKENVLPKFDWIAEYNNGVEVNVALAKNLLIQRIDAKPKNPEGSPEVRKQYVQAAEEVRRLMMGVKTMDDLISFRTAIRDRMSMELPKHLTETLRSLEYHRRELEREPKPYELEGRKRTDQFDPKTGRRIYEDLTVEEWRGRIKERILARLEDIKKYEVNSKLPYHVLGDKFANFFLDSDSANRTLDTVRKNTKAWEDLLSPEQREGEKKEGKKKGRGRVDWERKLENPYYRSGGRKVNVQKPEDAVKQFGLRGVQFGHWVDDESGKFHLVKASEAFQDLADVLGVDDKNISMNGRLSIAFGARGKGGKQAAVAHYEPASQIINITKEKGAGSLAHEWGHGLDHIMGEVAGISGFGSDGFEDAKGVHPEVKQAYAELMEAIHKGDGTHSYTVHIPNKMQPIRLYVPRRKRDVEQRGLHPDVIKEHVESVKNKFERERASLEWNIARGYGRERNEKKLKSLPSREKRELNALYQELMYHEFKRTGTQPESLEVPIIGESEYLDRMRMMDGDSARPYYSSPTEMFARVFESYIEQKLNDSGKTNHYLVGGTSERVIDHYEKRGIERSGLPPFPRKGERKLMFEKMEKLLHTLKTTGTIQKAFTMDLQKGWNPDQPRDKDGKFSRFHTVYHTTDDPNFRHDPNFKNRQQELGRGLYVSTAEDMDYWHRALPNKETGNGRKYVVPMDTSEARFIHEHSMPSQAEMSKFLVAHHGSSKAALEQVKKETPDGDTFDVDPFHIAVKRAYAKANGYDGIATTDRDEGSQLMLFDDSKVKYHSALTVDEFFTKKRRGELAKGIENELLNGEQKRFAYEVANPSAVFYIPVNRLQMIYQTEEATNWDKVQENMDKMRAGEQLEPVVIGYDHDIHDGHHRWQASRALDYTHVPCIVGGTDEVRKQRAVEMYAGLWKSWNESEHPRDQNGRFTTGGGLPLYHGTKLASAKRIQAEGFKPNRSGHNDMGNCVYFKSPAFDPHEQDEFAQTARTVNFFSGALGDDNELKSNARGTRVIQAVIDPAHVLDCTKGRPKELQDLIDEKSWYGKEGNKKKGAPRWDKDSSPYEAYAKKYGIKCIVDKLDTAWEDEGWQIGVYDPSILQITDVGKYLNSADGNVELIKALAAASEAPYCLLHHAMGAAGLTLYIGATE